MKCMKKKYEKTKLPINLKIINKTIKSNMWRWSDNKWNAQCACPAYLFRFTLLFFSSLISFHFFFTILSVAVVPLCVVYSIAIDTYVDVPLPLSILYVQGTRHCLCSFSLCISFGSLCVIRQVTSFS